MFISCQFVGSCVGVPVIPLAESPVRIAVDKSTLVRVTSWKIALEKFALVNVVPTKEISFKRAYFKSALLRFADGPIK